MKALVIGYGSIGKRHVGILKELGLAVIIHSKQDLPDETVYKNLDVALDEHPDYVVIANTTLDHHGTYLHLVKQGYSGKVLIEKPIFKDYQPIEPPSFTVWVGYQLRFHPALQELKECLLNEEIVTVQAYAGQYLPSWRPQRDYPSCYSASKQGGGGVLRDLSHELDYVNWLTGGWLRLTALGGNFSSLKIDSDDNFSILMETKACLNTIVHVNYIDRIHQRKIIINTNHNTYVVDLYNHVLQKNNEIKQYAVKPNDNYKKMHMAILESNHSSLCGWDDAIDVMKMVHAAETAVSNKCWVTRW